MRKRLVKYYFCTGFDLFWNLTFRQKTFWHGYFISRTFQHVLKQFISRGVFGKETIRHINVSAQGLFSTGTFWHMDISALEHSAKITQCHNVPMPKYPVAKKPSCQNIHKDRRSMCRNVHVAKKSPCSSEEMSMPKCRFQNVRCRNKSKPFLCERTASYSSYFKE